LGVHDVGDNNVSTWKGDQRVDSSRGELGRPGGFIVDFRYSGELVDVKKSVLAHNKKKEWKRKKRNKKKRIVNE
jgi:hypothetical protein